MKCFLTNNREYINIEAVQAITPIRLCDMYEGDDRLSLVGNRSLKLFDDYDKIDLLGGTDNMQRGWSFNRYAAYHLAEKRGSSCNEIIAWCVHLICPSGGNNTSHFRIFISLDDFERMKKQLKIV